MLARLLERLRRFNAQKKNVATLGVPVAVAFVMSVIAMFAVYNFAPLTNAEQFLADLQMAGVPPLEAQDSNIAVVAITEDTLSQFPYRTPVDRKFVSDLLRTIASEGPRAIGLDLLIDQPTEEAKDNGLHATLREISVPLVVSYVQIDSVVNEAQSAFLDEFVPEKLRGLANVGTDQFDLVRTIYPGGDTKAGYMPSFTRALAQAVGVTTPPQPIPIAWHGRPNGEMDAFPEYPAHALQFLPKDLLKGKIVLIGSDITLVDRHRTPYSTLDASGEGMAGVMVQAHALSQLLRGVRAPQAPWPSTWLVTFGLGIVGAGLGGLHKPVAAKVGAGFGLGVLYWGSSVALYHFGGPIMGLIAPTLSMATSFSSMEALSGSEARAQREFIKGVFSHHVAPKVVDQLLSDPAKVASLEGERREMTFLFTDVADFTTMSEGVDSKELGRVLNAYLEVMTEIVQKHGGMVDKFIGDAVFGIFNAPIDQPGHAQAAVRCALEMDRFSLAFSGEQCAQGIPFGLTRIGVHTGTAVIGNFGSRTRHNYTASGDAVNTASRLEGLNKHFGTRISVSGQTRALCPNIRFRPTVSVAVKGKKTMIDLYEPLQEDDQREDFIARYCDAYEKLKDGAPEAAAMFEALAKDAPKDGQVAFHLGRIHHGVMNVSVVMTEK